MAVFFSAVGKFIGVRPIEEVSATFSKRALAIEVEQQYNPTLVVDLVKTEARDNLNLAGGFKPGDMIRIWIDVVTRKTTNGNWFPSLTCFKIEKFVPQVADDFIEPEFQDFNAPMEQLPAGEKLPF